MDKAEQLARARRARASLGFALNHASSLQSQARTLHGATHQEVGGHNLGDLLIAELARAADTLGAAITEIGVALDAAARVGTAEDGPPGQEQPPWI
ncbi:MAG: hypothetical protein GX555_15475 [Actinomycetales bacterium]|nr:hypothetical protein [Actinomycetales bacterium]